MIPDFQYVLGICILLMFVAAGGPPQDWGV